MSGLAESENVESVEENNGVSPENEISVEKLADNLHKELVIINGRINDMNRKSLVKNLQNLNLSTNGNDTALKKRLKTHYRLKKLPPSCLESVKPLYPFYVVVDFEATCNSKVNLPDYSHEIIEFPAVLVDSRKRAIVDEFHEYVKPNLNPKLSQFCSNLTGISQETVDNASDFPAVLNRFELWLEKHKLGSKHKYGFVTDGPWDMGRFLYLQCELSEIPFPHYANKWVNIKRTYSRFYKTTKMRLVCMLEEMGIELQGRLHSGLDDSRNIATLLIAMMNDGALIKTNETLKGLLARSSHANKNKNVVIITTIGVSKTMLVITYQGERKKGLKTQVSW